MQVYEVRESRLNVSSMLSESVTLSRAFDLIVFLCRLTFQPEFTFLVLHSELFSFLSVCLSRASGVMTQPDTPVSPPEAASHDL